MCSACAYPVFINRLCCYGAFAGISTSMIRILGIVIHQRVIEHGEVDIANCSEVLNGREVCKVFRILSRLMNQNFPNRRCEPMQNKNQVPKGSRMVCLARKHNSEQALDGRHW